MISWILGGEKGLPDTTYGDLKGSPCIKTYCGLQVFQNFQSMIESKQKQGQVFYLEHLHCYQVTLGKTLSKVQV